MTNFVIVYSIPVFIGLRCCHYLLLHTILLLPKFWYSECNQLLPHPFTVYFYFCSSLERHGRGSRVWLWPAQKTAPVERGKWMPCFLDHVALKPKDKDKQWARLVQLSSVIWWTPHWFQLIRSSVYVPGLCFSISFYQIFK